MMFKVKATFCSLILSRLFSFVTAVLALVLCASGVASAETAGVTDSKDAKEEMVVTGTRKAGMSATETLSPVDMIDGSAIMQQGSFDMTETLTKLNPSLNTQRFPIADGTAFVRPVSLRNLAPDQTLVLVNGTRRHRSALVNLQISPLGTVNQGTQAVDFAAFPASAIKRVEVLRDGASAQYGSDAIAGVINVILNDSSEGFAVNAKYGEYFEGDGERISIDGNAGFALGANGFLNLSAEYSTSDITSRGNARPDAAQVAVAVGDASLVPYNGLGQRWGDPDVDALKLFLNTALAVSDNVELFANASYMDNETIGGFFYRGPVLDPAEQFTARSTLQVDTDGDFLPDGAPVSLINDITGAGLDPADYLVPLADVPGATSPSNWVLRNPIHTEFPGGYSPLFGANIMDYAAVVGARGDIGSISWDLRGRFAENEVEYVLSDSINPSLGRLSPTTFNPGTLTQEESSVNLDFVKTFEDSPLNIGFGLEWRNETYDIGAGDQGSTEVGPTFAQFGVGSDGFQGFFPETTGSFEKDSIAAYLDVETDFTERLSGAAAVRYEDHDGFDSSIDFKIASRFEFTDTIAVRGTVNTGFRVPTPGQVNTLNVTTTADTAGNLIPSGTYPVNHPVALALGAVPLETEESLSYTLGLVMQPFSNTTLTLDFYNITVDDRLALLATTVDQAAVDDLNAQGFPNADQLLNSAANYFSNSYDSDVTGIDLVITSNFDVANGALLVDFRHSYNNQDIKNIKAGTINASQKYDLENQVPNNRSVLTMDYGKARFGGFVRLNYYGDWKTTGGLFSPGDASDAATYDGQLLVDIEARYSVTDVITLAVGGENILDTMPDREQDGTLQFLGVQDSLTSPFGSNGGFWYARATAAF